MATIFQDLFQFSTHVPPINLSFHQYLLSGNEPVLVHTGNLAQAKNLVPQLNAALNGQSLNYIFISHFEADECGGLSHILEHFATAKPVCSEVTARQLNGFGLASEVIIKKPGDMLTTADYELQFLAYPSEMHLWQGLLAIERKRGIFFSSDLMFGLGNAGGAVTDANWADEIRNISPEQVPAPEQRATLQDTLLQLKPQFVATGHGPCLKLT